MASESAVDKNHIEAVSRAVTLLYAFTTPPHKFGVTEISKRTGLTKNQAYRLLQTLLERNIVVKDPSTAEYSLGFGIIELGAAAARGSRVFRAADPVLDQLEAETGETINLIARVDNTSAVCIAKRDSRWRLQITGRVGTRFPLHAGATPKLLLAYCSEEVIENYLTACTPFTRFTPNTITDPAKLREALTDIRLQGFSIGDGELDVDVWAVAAPIQDQRGTVTSGISIGMPSTRARAEERQRYISMVLEGARLISERLGAIELFDGPMRLDSSSQGSHELVPRELVASRS